jgi:hypothetical protein
MVLSSERAVDAAAPERGLRSVLQPTSVNQRYVMARTAIRQGGQQLHRTPPPASSSTAVPAEGLYQGAGIDGGGGSASGPDGCGGAEGLTHAQRGLSALLDSGHFQPSDAVVRGVPLCTFPACPAAP